MRAAARKGLSMNDEIRQMIGEIARLMADFSAALERRATELQTHGGDPDVSEKLAKGADTMRDSGNIYLSWARHYAALTQGAPQAADEEDEADFGS